MKEEQKYMELLKEIGRVLSDKNEALILKDFEVDMLRRRLSDAEKEIEELKKGN